MEAYFATMLEGVRHERSLILLPSLADLDTVKQLKFTDREINVLKKLALEKLHGQKRLN